MARLSYDTDEERLKKEFDPFGAIKMIRVIRDKETNKSRGYAFIEFERERDFYAAYRQADGKVIDGKRIQVDAEMGRIKLKWRPMRLGGGRGDARRSIRHPFRSPKKRAGRSRSRSDDRRRRFRDDRMHRPRRGMGGRGYGRDFSSRGDRDDYRMDRRRYDRRGGDRRPFRDDRGGGRGFYESSRSFRDNDYNMERRSRSRKDPDYRRDRRDRDRHRDRDRDRDRDRHRGDRYSRNEHAEEGQIRSPRRKSRHKKDKKKKDKKKKDKDRKDRDRDRD